MLECPWHASRRLQNASRGLKRKRKAISGPKHAKRLLNAPKNTKETLKKGHNEKKVIWSSWITDFPTRLFLYLQKKQYRHWQLIGCIAIGIFLLRRQGQTKRESHGIWFFICSQEHHLPLRVKFGDQSFKLVCTCIFVNLQVFKFKKSWFLFMCEKVFFIPLSLLDKWDKLSKENSLTSIKNFPKITFLLQSTFSVNSHVHLSQSYKQ